MDSVGRHRAGGLDCHVVWFKRDDGSLRRLHHQLHHQTWEALGNLKIHSDTAERLPAKVMILLKAADCLVTCGMKAPNVLVLSRMGEPCGICGDRARKVLDQCDGRKSRLILEVEAHHVVGDVQAEGSGFVVDEGCRVGSEGGQAHVQHVVVLGWQGKGCGGERRLLMLPNVVKFTLSDKETAETEKLCHNCLFF